MTTRRAATVLACLLGACVSAGFLVSPAITEAATSAKFKSALLGLDLLACNECQTCGTFGHEHVSGGNGGGTKHECQNYSESCQHSACDREIRPVGSLDIDQSRELHLASGTDGHSHANRAHNRPEVGQRNAPTEPDYLRDLRLALLASEMELVKEIIRKAPSSVELVKERNAIQVVSCDGSISAHFPLSPREVNVLIGE